MTQYREASASQCYHCGLPVPALSSWQVEILGEPRAMCCLGCQAVAQSIVDNGLQDYYRHRTELPKTAEQLVPEALRQLSLYDHPDVQKSFVQIQGKLREASLILEGITCAACIWLNERHLMQLPGVAQVSVNYTSHRARVVWDDAHIKLSDILLEISKIGYHAHPFSAQQQEALRQQQRKIDIRRLAVAGLCAGQVMMIAGPLYGGVSQGLEFASAQVLRWFSVIMTIPAMLYAAWPFYQGAWRNVQQRHVGMDVPIVLGLIAAFCGSLWATWRGQGDVYFDTITMLIFFLLGTRFLERNAREKSIQAAENLLRLTPAIATRLHNDAQTLVPVAELNVGDILLVKPGETIAADGILYLGRSSVDESLLTGESAAIVKQVGDAVFAGSVNYESPIQVCVTAVAEDTMLASISRLLDRAQAEKPKLAKTADQVASYFTWLVLALVVLVIIGWSIVDSSKILSVVLTVLVVSCPCALSIAAPAAFAAAGSHLVKRGILLTRGHVLETLAKVNHVVLDKTGTLTTGQMQLVASHALAQLDIASCLQLAASLEQQSEHVLAKAFDAKRLKQTLLPVSDLSNIAGQGVVGVIAGHRYALGNAALHQHLSAFAQQSMAANSLHTQIWLSDEQQLLARFELADQVREDAKTLIQSLQAQGIQVTMLSGDAQVTVGHYANLLGIQQYQAHCSPQDKLSVLRQLQEQGQVVAMVGDGINDAPVLAGAQVSIAMGGGTQMARVSADAVLLSEHLSEIQHAIAHSRFAVRVIRQNFAWALCYNAVVLPLAALGLMTPWMAAIGMSVSSLVVVMNALRLR
jgi:Cu2+-exporting ATPase